MMGNQYTILQTWQSYIAIGLHSFIDCIGIPDMPEVNGVDISARCQLFLLWRATTSWLDQAFRFLPGSDTLIREKLARWFPTQSIWKLGFFQPSIMKNDNFHELCWYFKVFRSIFEHFKVQKTFQGVILKHLKIYYFFVANLFLFMDPLIWETTSNVVNMGESKGLST
jgi:hypothetical protein